MNIGLLRHRLTIQNPSRVADGRGGYTETWVSGETIWGDVQDLSARSRFFASQVVPGVTHEVRIRSRSDVKSGTRFLWGSRYLLATTAPINTDGKNVEMVVSCTEVLV